MIQGSNKIRIAKPDEYDLVGALMVQVYSQLDGFPSPKEQPTYYSLLSNVRLLAEKPDVELLVTASESGEITGAVVYFGDMQFYGSGGTATLERNASGFRLLAVSPAARGQGLGKLLTDSCILRAKSRKHENVIIHTTEAMQVAWKMYEQIGFERAEEFDFSQNGLNVFGFRLVLETE